MKITSIKIVFNSLETNEKTIAKAQKEIIEQGAECFFIIQKSDSAD